MLKSSLLGLGRSKPKLTKLAELLIFQVGILADPSWKSPVVIVFSWSESCRTNQRSLWRQRGLGGTKTGSYYKFTNNGGHTMDTAIAAASLELDIFSFNNNTKDPSLFLPGFAKCLVKHHLHIIAHLKGGCAFTVAPHTKRKSFLYWYMKYIQLIWETFYRVCHVAVNRWVPKLTTQR